MIGGESVEDIDAALAEAFGSAPEAVEMVAPAVRRAKEKRMRLSPDDGRRKRRTGRTAQFNVKMRADLKAQIVRFRPIGTVEADLETARSGRPYRSSDGCIPERIATKATREGCEAYRRLEGELEMGKQPPVWSKSPLRYGGD